MSLLASIAWALGPSVGKALLKVWLNDSPVRDVISDAIDKAGTLGHDAASARKARRQIEITGEAIAQQMRPLFDVEGRALGDDGRKAVVREVANTLCDTIISVDILVQLNMEPRKLAEYLIASHPEAVKGFSEGERIFYERMLSEVSSPIIKVTQQLAEFTASAVADTLQGQDHILQILEQLVARPSQEEQDFQRKYLNEVERRLDRMELFGIPPIDIMHRNQSLVLSYITLQTEYYAPDVARQRRLFQRLSPTLIRTSHKQGTAQSSARMQTVTTFEDGSAANNASVDSKGKEPIFRNGSVEEVLAANPRLVVRGEAGSGKTTLLKWIAIHSAKDDFSSNMQQWRDKVPFLIRLRECVDTGFPKPEAFVELLTPMISGQMPPGWVHRLLELGQGIVLIDGIDELPQSQRHQMLERLDALIRAYPFAHYVITSRPYAVTEEKWPEWPEWINKENFSEVTLQPMSSTQVEDFIDHWHSALISTIVDPEEATELQVLPENLKRQLKERPELRRLANSPLLCGMICALHRERRQRLPAERLKLYSQCVEMLITARDEVRRVPSELDYPHLGDDQKLALLQHLAYWLMQNGWSDAEVASIDGKLASRLSMMNLRGNVDASSVRRYFVERSNLLREPVQGRIDFAHRTFQEFLAAQAAVKEADFGVLLQKAGDDQWRETIILASGLARRVEAEKLISDIMNKGKKSKAKRHALYLLAVACLETTVELKPTIREYVIAQAAQLFPPTNLEEAKAVAAAGEVAVPRLSGWKSQDEKVVAACVRALSLIGTDSALTALEEYADNRSFTVTQELVLGWDRFDGRVYAERILSKSATLFLQSVPQFEGLEHVQGLSILTIARINAPSDLSRFSNFATLETLQLGLRMPDIMRNPDLPQPREVETPILKLPTLPSLKILTLSVVGTIRPSLTDLVGEKWLSKKRNIETLELYGLNFSDNKLDSLTGFSSLRRLNLYQPKRLQEIASLANLKKLRLLNIIGAPDLVDISPLANLQELTFLSLDGTSVTDLSPLTHLKNLKTLRIVHGSRSANWSAAVSIVRTAAQVLGGRTRPSLNIAPLKNHPSLEAIDVAGYNLEHRELIDETKVRLSIR